MTSKEDLYKLDELSPDGTFTKGEDIPTYLNTRKVKGIRERKQFIPRWFNGSREI